MAKTAHDLDRAGAPDTGRSLISIDPQVNWRRFPPAFNKLDLLPAYIPVITYTGGDYGDDVDEASASTTTPYTPRNQEEKATMIGTTLAPDVGRPRGLVEPHKGYPVGGAATAPAPTVTSVTPDEAPTLTGPLILTIIGTNFTDYSIVRGVGRVNVLQSRYQSPTVLQAMVDLDTVAAGTYGLQVVDHDIESAPVTFTVTGSTEEIEAPEGGAPPPDGGEGGWLDRIPTPQ